MNYPLPCRREEAAADIIKAVNDACEKHALPYHVLEDILYRLYVDARDGARRECAAARENYLKLSKMKEDAKNECTDQAGA